MNVKIPDSKIQDYSDIVEECFSANDAFKADKILIAVILQLAERIDNIENANDKQKSIDKINQML